MVLTIRLLDERIPPDAAGGSLSAMLKLEALPWSGLRG